MRLENLTWPQAEEYFRNHDTVIVPLGSLECHGRHMPLGTDTMIPNKIVDVLEPLTDALIAPAMPYGSTDYLSVFPEQSAWDLKSCMKSCTGSLTA